MPLLPGSRLPAEWEPQDGVQLTWPHAGTDWLRLLDRVIPVYERLVGLLADVGEVVIGAPAPEVATLARRFANLGIPAGRVHLYPVASNDTWARDHGPITVLTDSGPCLLDYRFNGWGGKYAFDLDDAITADLYRQGAYPGARLLGRDLVLEGGAIESDGAGTLLTTAQCLLNPNRNPALDRAAIERALCDDLGVHRINWLHHGAMEGDDTDSHIDTLARLGPGNVILHQACDDPQDGHYTELEAMAAELRAMTSAAGGHYRLIPLPWPAPKFDEKGNRMPATYANFLVCNGLVIVPTYRDTRDGEALARVGEAFPGYRVEGLDCLPVIHQHGSLHCITMQLPRGTLHPAAGARGGGRPWPN